MTSVDPAGDDHGHPVVWVVLQSGVHAPAGAGGPPDHGTAGCFVPSRVQPIPGGPNFSQPSTLVGTYVASPDVDILQHGHRRLGRARGLVLRGRVQDLCLAPRHARRGRARTFHPASDAEQHLLAVDRGGEQRDIISRQGSRPTGEAIRTTTRPSAGALLGWHASPRTSWTCP